MCPMLCLNDAPNVVCFELGVSISDDLVGFESGAEYSSLLLLINASLLIKIFLQLSLILL